MATPRIRHVTVMVGKVENVPGRNFAKRICPACKQEKAITAKSKFMAHKNGVRDCKASGLTADQFNKLNNELIAARKSVFG